MPSRVWLVLVAGLALFVFLDARTANSRKRKDLPRASPVSMLAQAEADQPEPESLESDEGGRDRHHGCGPSGFKETFRNPPEIRSKYGILDTTLTISRGQVDI